MPLISLQAVGQKKVTPVSQSLLTGIELPAGSKQDNRILMEATGKMLLEIETKKTNTTISKTEILYLPVATAGFNADSLVSRLSKLGWNITPVAGDNKYVWLQKDNRSVITYFSMDKKETSLYFGEVSGTPLLAGNENNNSGNQNTTVTTQQTTGQTVQPPAIQTTTRENTNAGNDTQTPPNNPTPATSSGFAFSTTNFDDGWTSTVQEDWVEVTKGNIKVLLHYPKDGTIFPADPAPLINGAWNILVAPRYSTLANYKTAYINTYDRPYLGFGNATDKATGKELFVLLFRQGGSGWLEFISPDKNTFVQFFKFDPYAIQWDSETDLLKPLAIMVNYNKFAVAAADFKGKWTSDFTGVQQLYNIYTGNYAGMNINQSNEEFVFTGGNSYSWKLLVVNGMVGTMNYNQVQSTGKFTVLNNWQVQFSKIESGPKTFHAFFSCIKGARILNLLDAHSPGSGIYTKYGMAK